MAKNPLAVRRARAVAAAVRRDAAAVRAIARANGRCAKMLRAVHDAYVAEADARGSAWPEEALRERASHAESLAWILEQEATTHQREAARLEAEANRVEARAPRARALPRRR